MGYLVNRYTERTESLPGAYLRIIPLTFCRCKRLCLENLQMRSVSRILNAGWSVLSACCNRVDAKSLLERTVPVGIKLILSCVNTHSKFPLLQIIRPRRSDLRTLTRSTPVTKSPALPLMSYFRTKTAAVCISPSTD